MLKTLKHIHDYNLDYKATKTIVKQRNDRWIKSLKHRMEFNMKNVSVSDTIEVLTMGVQAGFIDSLEEIDAVSSIVSRLTRKFLSDCQETNIFPTDEAREVIATAEDFVNVVVNSHNVDFIDEDSHRVCLCIIDTIRTVGGLKALAKSNKLYQKF